MPESRGQLLYYLPREAPRPIVLDRRSTGIAFLSSKMYPLLPVGSLLICELNPGLMRRFSLDGVDLDVVGDGSVVDRYNPTLDVARLMRRPRLDPYANAGPVAVTGPAILRNLASVYCTVVYSKTWSREHRSLSPLSCPS